MFDGAASTRSSVAFLRLAARAVECVIPFYLLTDCLLSVGRGDPRRRAARARRPAAVPVTDRETHGLSRGRPYCIAFERRAVAANRATGQQGDRATGLQPSYVPRVGWDTGTGFSGFQGEFCRARRGDHVRRMRGETRST
eukprot:scaffold16428_cov63-Phaeocystis_antarctica.AAC.5